MKGKTSLLVLCAAFFLFSCVGRMKKDMDMGASSIQPAAAETGKTGAQPAEFKTLIEYTEENYAGEKQFSSVQGSTEAYSVSPSSMKELSAKEDLEEKGWFKRDWPMGLLIGGLILGIIIAF